MPYANKATYVARSADRTLIRYFDTIKAAKPFAIEHGGTIERNFCFTSRRLVHDFRTEEVRAWHVAEGYC